MDKFRLGLEWFLNPDHTPLLVGLEQGWFADAGLDLELIEPEEHLDAVEAIERGEMEAAITEPLHLVADLAAGQPVVGFTRFLHTNGGVMYFAGSGITRPRDMAGKRIQYPGAPGPGGPAIVMTMIEADGGSCRVDDFGHVNRGFYHTDALADGEADLATLVFYNFEVLEARHRGFDADFFALKDWGVPDFCQLVLITAPEELESRRDAFDSLVRVLRKSIDYMMQNPDRAREIYRSRTGADMDDQLESAIFSATLPCFTYDFSMSADYYSILQNWMQRTGQIERTVDPGGYWTNELAL